MTISGPVIVTGGTGFVGANLVRRLLAQGLDVHLIARADHATWRVDDLGPAAVLHRADLPDAAAVHRVIGDIGPRHVFHLAAHGAYSWEQDLARMSRVNLEGTVNVVRASLAAGVRSIVAAGSSSEYGYVDHAPLEHEAVAPNSNYAITKVAATHAAQLLSRQSGVPVTTLRLYSVYGPYEDPARLVPAVVRAGLAGGLPRLANAASARDFVHVDDVCNAFLLAAEVVDEPAAVFNVATGHQVSLREVVEVSRAHFGIAQEPQFGSMADRPWDTECWVGNAAALRALGWQPRWEFTQGFARTADWWSANVELLSAPSAPATSGAV